MNLLNAYPAGIANASPNIVVPIETITELRVQIQNDSEDKIWLKCSIVTLSKNPPPNEFPGESATSRIHRIGRTGRAGRSGEAILFVNQREKHFLRNLENSTRNNKTITKETTICIDEENIKSGLSLRIKITNETKLIITTIGYRLRKDSTSAGIYHLLARSSFTTDENDFFEPIM